MVDPTGLFPSIGFYQLEAQLRTYRLLVRCLQDFTREPESDAESEPSYSYPSDESLPLLARSSRLDYYGPPHTMALKYLDNLLKASLDEAIDYLRQLRQDPESY
jgi:hypothetical protein